MLTPYFQNDSVTIYHGDCKEILPQLPKADLLLTDPPYDQSKAGGGMVAQRETFQKISATLSSFEPSLYWNKLYSSTVVPHGYIFTSKNCLDFFITKAKELNLNWDLLVYGKNNPIPLKNNRYISSYEFIFFFRGSGCFWDNDAPFENYSKLKMVNCKPGEFGHPTEKDVGVLEQLIRLSTRKGELIIDPFMGSGTTLKAATGLGRKAIGIEKEEKYCEMAVKRLSQSSFSF